MAVAKENVGLNKGLRNGYFDRTSSSLIVPKPGKLLYRGYNIDDLARLPITCVYHKSPCAVHTKT